MKKNDRELLELAAKAAGVDGEYVTDYGSGDYYYQGSNDGILTCATGGVSCRVWNPLEDDGDALRLAVNLSMHLQHLEGARESRAIAGDDWVAEGWEQGKDAATRRAIVVAAAEIWSKTP